MDYKKLYLIEKINALKNGLDALSLRFEQLQRELPVAEKELAEYEKSCKEE